MGKLVKDATWIKRIKKMPVLFLSNSRTYSWETIKEGNCIWEITF
ncbi:hypothetical protein DSOL_1197 [Desulfosporosinus metallidurans]|uniref:Uncharacterized protein n=1 Tax=Desulfosporosinus metallidurans TaxID=1888891 RepID=A0A1Q8QZM1_9FIRM|nr:hypothetical protein DSOL_1197 [Desulfosporosinus metallidurans]